MALPSYSFIELALWKKKSLFSTKQIACIRYSADSFVCLLNSKPEYIDAKNLVLASFERKPTTIDCIEVGNKYLEKIVSEGKIFVSGRLFLEEYMRNLSNECISV